MKESYKGKNKDRKIQLIKRRIKNRTIQKESIYRCFHGKLDTSRTIRNANDKTWYVILFITLNNYSSIPVTSSDVYLGTGLPKRTVIRVLKKLENLNVIERTTDDRDARVTRIKLSDCFATEIDNHFQDCLNKGI